MIICYLMALQIVASTDIKVIDVQTMSYPENCNLNSSNPEAIDVYLYIEPPKIKQHYGGNYSKREEEEIMSNSQCSCATPKKMFCKTVICHTKNPVKLTCCDESRKHNKFFTVEKETEIRCPRADCKCKCKLIRSIENIFHFSHKKKKHRRKGKENGLNKCSHPGKLNIHFLGNDANLNQMTILPDKDPYQKKRNITNYTTSNNNDKFELTSLVNIPLIHAEIFKGNNYVASDSYRNNLPFHKKEIRLITFRKTTTETQTVNLNDISCPDNLLETEGVWIRQPGNSKNLKAVDNTIKKENLNEANKVFYISMPKILSSSLNQSQPSNRCFKPSSCIISTQQSSGHKYSLSTETEITGSNIQSPTFVLPTSVLPVSSTSNSVESEDSNSEFNKKIAKVFIPDMNTYYLNISSETLVATPQYTTSEFPQNLPSVLESLDQSTSSTQSWTSTTSTDQCGEEITGMTPIYITIKSNVSTVIECANNTEQTSKPTTTTHKTSTIRSTKQSTSVRSWGWHSKENYCTSSIRRTTTKKTGKGKTTLFPIFQCFNITQQPLFEAAKVLDIPVDIMAYNQTTAIENYIGYLNEKSAMVYNKHILTEWEYETNTTNEMLEKEISAVMELTQYQRTLNRVLEPLIKMSFRNRTIERQISLLYVPGKSILPDVKLTEYEQILFGMKDTFQKGLVQKYKDPDACLPLWPDITTIMTTSRDLDELKHYWIGWRNVTGKKIRTLFTQYIELSKLMANLSGFSGAGEMWLRRYETEDFMQLAGSYWSDVRPLYRQLHAYVRRRLRLEFGETVIASWGSLIPIHLTGDMWGQNWRNLYNLTAPFPEKPIILYNQDLKKKGYTITKMAKEADIFFHSLGFPSLTGNFWKNSIFQRDNNTMMNCDPGAWDMYDGVDFRVKMCAKINIEDFYEMHHEIAHVQYFIQYSSLPFAFRDGANPAFHEAIANAVLLSVQSHSHLRKLDIGDVPEDNEDTDINFLLRLALEKIAFIPYGYILDLWRYRVLQGDIKSDEYNTKWWELREQYQGVMPPLSRNEEDLDPASKFHITANSPYIRYYLAILMEFQFHEALCHFAGHRGPLHRCDISSSPLAGEMLKGVMELGASEHWRYALQLLTGRRSIESRPLLKFFDPLYSWLKKENQRNKVQVGW